MSLAETIEAVLKEKFLPLQLKIVDESSAHAGHKSEGGHFRVMIVSDSFSGIPPVARHRLINQALHRELKDGRIHALSLQPLSPEEYNKTV